MELKYPLPLSDFGISRSLSVTGLLMVSMHVETHVVSTFQVSRSGGEGAGLLESWWDHSQVLRCCLLLVRAYLSQALSIYVLH